MISFSYLDAKGQKLALRRHEVTRPTTSLTKPPHSKKHQNQIGSDVCNLIAMPKQKKHNKM